MMSQVGTAVKKVCGGLHMGNAASSSKRQWNWEYRNGRANLVFKQPKKSLPKKPLFKKQASNDYDWWIFNPDPPKKNRKKNRK